MRFLVPDKGGAAGSIPLRGPHTKAGIDLSAIYGIGCDAADFSWANRKRRLIPPSTVR